MSSTIAEDTVTEVLREEIKAIDDRISALTTMRQHKTAEVLGINTPEFLMRKYGLRVGMPLKITMPLIYHFESVDRRGLLVDYLKGEGAEAYFASIRMYDTFDVLVNFTTGDNLSQQTIPLKILLQGMIP